jgi:hypothetical protein
MIYGSAETYSFPSSLALQNSKFVLGFPVLDFPTASFLPKCGFGLMPTAEPGKGL